jgi:hypothetical protein
VVVAGFWVATVYFFPVPKSPATYPSEPMSLNAQGAVSQPAPTIAAPTVPSQASIAQKTVEACQEEWRAIRGAVPRTTTEKAYVAECRAGGATKEGVVIDRASNPSTSSPIIEPVRKFWRSSWPDR